MRFRNCLLASLFGAAACLDAPQSQKLTALDGSAVSARSSETVDQVLDELATLSSATAEQRRIGKAQMRKALDRGAQFGASSDPRKQELTQRLLAAYERELKAKGAIPDGGSSFTLALGSSEQARNADALLIRDPKRSPPDILVLNRDRASAADVDRALKSIRRVWKNNGTGTIMNVGAEITFIRHSGEHGSARANAIWSKLQTMPRQQLDAIGSVPFMTVSLK